ncbi:hypothetical protein V6N11_033411 [Hibiscus sabdariffa]|uniref:hAT-like transposase RNase-H fold domain-containing protein n=1 Tax=Hibiscus sabdariffa TaxID=183260 RepID=A0ABR2PY11_9ROSI
MALSMKKKQEKYWGNINNINLMLLLDPRRKWKYVNWVIEKSFDEDIALELRDRISHALSSMFASYVVVFDANDKGLDSSVTPMNLEVNATIINDMDDVQTMLEHQFEREIGYGEETLEDLEKLESDLVDVAVIKDIEILNMYDD